ncbi:response regulator transcription factor [Kibdelosporangium phytohabitans]|uniref:MerR family transcriptional regulator n=1 Tax=Kibdelosporangium phytohabitans TaxID=860235 RepID=A0A0N9I403_9PSEU|nr:response regulator transcription factor [Kibdelosporangium phytohabitans]ALG09528.1 MerR family transcriptional regulator [Kibdelosporangium phytohabitans]
MVRVLIAEDTGILRETLSALIALQDDLDVVAEIGTGDAIVPSAQRFQPDVAVVDIDLPHVDGLTATARLREEVPGCQVLILTGLPRPGNLPAALAAGAIGFLLKDTSAADLVAAIHRVAAGEKVIDATVAANALQQRQSPLSPRETDVLRLYAAGVDPRDIAAELFLSYGTVRNYLASAMVKLDARNRVDAIRIATEEGWL